MSAKYTPWIDGIAALVARTRAAPRLSVLLAMAPLLLFWPDLRHFVESRMALHMLLEFPLLMASGWCLRRWWQRRRPMQGGAGRWEQLLDWRGWTGATFVTVVTVVWMVPSMLDAALLALPVAAFKYVSWWLAGWLLASSWYRMDAEVLLFFAGNLAWMTATAGLLYLEAPSQLCVSYLQDDQQHAGLGLVVLAVAAGGLALRQMMRSGEAVQGVTGH
ncbi:MAG: hypothetical protein QMB72_06080 [Brachymonas denitrificans]|uniref:hypothetical protein n=1 Tax=Brachymonas denitrificans TaxID=28220 RepID=UPI00352F5073